MNNFQGSVLSEGLCIGSIIKLEKKLSVDRNKHIEKNESAIKNECKLFLDAKDIVNKKLNCLLDEAKNLLNDTESDILDGYIAILNDPELETDIIEKIKDELYSVESSLSRTASEYIDDMLALDDEYLQQRADDFKQLFDMLLEATLNSNKTSKIFASPHILVAESISPIDLSEIDKTKLLGIIVKTGSKTSHAAIVARANNIPMVSNIDIAQLKATDTVIIDEANIYINPSPELIKEFEHKLEKANKELEYLKTIISKPCITKSGEMVQLMANIGSIDDLNNVINQNADGIGLFRTEFLLDNAGKNFPREDIQFEIYKNVATQMRGKPVTIRTFDIGGDKSYPCFPIQKEENPFLGWRGIRCMLDDQELLYTQLKAIFRAGVYGNIHIMFPMITNEDEIHEIKQVITRVKEDLNKNHIDYNPNLNIGIMIETPAAALIADKLATMVDFFSIGTNDLTQYTIAVDRGNAKISKLYNEAHPAVLKLIHEVVRTAKDNNIHVCMCGEMAGNSLFTKQLIELGLRCFSMNAIQIQKIKDIIINI